MKDIAEKIAEVRKHTFGGQYDLAVNDIIDIIEIISQPLQVAGYERLVVERDTYKALVENCIQATPQPQTIETGNALTDAGELQELLDLTQKTLRETCQREIKLAYDVKVLAAASDSWQEKFEAAAEERDNFRVLLRQCYPHISPGDLRIKVLVALPDVEQTE